MIISAQSYLRLKPDDPIVLSNAFPAVEDEFYESLRTESGSWKTTRRRRLDLINDLLFELLTSSKEAPSTVMDIGISSGITTLEWLAEFVRRGLGVKMIGTDVSLSVYSVTLGRNFHVMIEPSGSILQLDLFGRGLRLWCGWRDYFNGSFIIRKTLGALARQRLARLAIKFPIKGPPATRLADAVSGPYQLVTPQLRARHDVILADDNILAPNPREYTAVADVVRIANVLQHTYFSEEQIRMAVRNIRARCRGEGSLVVVCRDKGSVLEGSILRAGKGGFSLERRLGPGSEVESYFIDYRS
jgi:hypothetical protein